MTCDSGRTPERLGRRDGTHGGRPALSAVSRRRARARLASTGSSRSALARSSSTAWRPSPKSSSGSRVCRSRTAWIAGSTTRFFLPTWYAASARRYPSEAVSGSVTGVSGAAAQAPWPGPARPPWCSSGRGSRPAAPGPYDQDSLHDGLRGWTGGPPPTGGGGRRRAALTVAHRGSSRCRRPGVRRQTCRIRTGARRGRAARCGGAVAGRVASRVRPGVEGL